MTGGRSLAWWFVLAMPCAAGCQDLLPEPPTTFVHGDWQFHAGDDPDWATSTASAAADLSGWSLADGQDPGAGERWAGIGWFRATLRIPQAYANERLQLWTLAAGAFEVYVDGELRSSFGDIDDVLLGGPTPQSQGRAVGREIRLGAGDHTVAVRFASNRVPDLDRVGFGSGFTLALDDPEKPTFPVDGLAPWRSTLWFIAGACFALAFLHLMLFIQRRRKLEHVFFALTSFGVAATMATSYWAVRVETVEASLVHWMAFRWALLLATLTGVRFIYAFFALEIPKHFWLIFAVGLGLAAGAWWLPLSWVLVMAIVCGVEQMRVLVLGLKRGLPGSRLLAAGAGLASIGGVMQSLAALDFFPMYRIALASPLFLLAAVSYSLARATAAREVALEEADKREALHKALEAAHEELKRTQAQLMESEKMASLGQLVAGVAHEINTPIGAIRSMHDSMARALEKLRGHLGGVLEAPIEDDAQLKKILKVLDNGSEVIGSGSERVSEIVKRLRSFARLDEADLQLADLRAGLDDTLLMVQHELGHRIEIVRDFDRLPELECHPRRLNQVFLNLLMNAIQSIEGEGEITIHGTFDDDEIRVSVTDSGAGIRAEDLEKIFDPGFTTKGVGVGTGLGLSICFRIVEDHGGRIEVKSEPGRGSTFTVVLPRRVAT